MDATQRLVVSAVREAILRYEKFEFQEIQEMGTGTTWRRRIILLRNWLDTQK